VCSSLSQRACSQEKVGKCCRSPGRLVQTEKCLGTEIAEVETKPGGAALGVRGRCWRRASGAARLRGALSGRVLGGAELCLRTERGQLKTREFCSVLPCVAGREAALRSAPATLSPMLGAVPGWCRWGRLLSCRPPVQRLGAPRASQLRALEWGNPEAGVILCDPNKERLGGEILC